MAIRETKRSLKIGKRYRFCLRLDAIHKKRFDLVIREGVPWERWILRNFSKMRVHARPSFIVTINLPSFVTLIRCFIGRSKPLGRLEEFGQAVFHKEVNRTWPIESGKEAKPLIFNGCRCEGLRYTMVARRPPIP